MSLRTSVTPAGTWRGHGNGVLDSFSMPVLYQLFSGKALTVLEAWRLCGIEQLSAVVYDLRRAGLDIEAMGPLAGEGPAYRLAGRCPQC